MNLDKAEPRPSSSPYGALVVSLALLVCVVWTCWSLLSDMSRKWSYDPTYSHGFLVPIIALVILWTRRTTFPELKADARPSSFLLILIGSAFQLASTYWYVKWLGGAALVTYLAGILVLLGGYRLLRWTAPALGFLLFMVPLPYRFEEMLKSPLQRASTVASTFALQTLGLPALAEGNVIVLNDVDLGVVDACSGLKMMVVFFAVSTAVALLINRPIWDKLLVILSSLPIALLVNTIRITVTGVLHETVGTKWANLVFHDLAGWLMMPLALVFLWLELRILDYIVQPAETPSPTLLPPEPRTALVAEVAGSRRPHRHR